jgi:hypothetical protein
VDRRRNGRAWSILKAVVAELEDRLSSMVAAKLRRCASGSCNGGREPTIDADAG